jgi:hypothetical protein
MVMIESAAPHPLDGIFLDFEKRSGWVTGISQALAKALSPGCLDG